MTARATERASWRHLAPRRPPTTRPYASSRSTYRYGYNGDGLRMVKTQPGGASELYSWDVSGNDPLMLADGSTYYVYGPGGVPLEQIGAPTISLTAVGANDETVTGGSQSSITVS